MMLKDRIASVAKGFFSDSVREIMWLLLIIFLIFLARTIGFGLYQVPTGSMETTMLVGERFLADKFTVLFSAPKRGDIISFNDPNYPYSDNWLKRLWQSYVWGPANWTKHVIGQPGDTVKGVIEDGKPVIYLNGQKLEEPYLNKYPLIQLCKLDPLQLQHLRKEVTDRFRNNVSQVSLDDILAQVDNIVAQVIDEYSEWRSYDPLITYDKQPFYRMKSSQVVGANERGIPVLGLCGKQSLKYPNMAIHPQPNKVVRKGNSYWSSSDEFYVELGPDQYWLMGDNRLGSLDSRFLGPIKDSLIHGKIIFRIISIMPSEYESYFSDGSSFIAQAWDWIRTSLLGDILLHPIDFWKRVRWNRCFQRVK